MRDAEFVLRFFTFKDNWLDFSSGMKRSMDTFMEDNQWLPEEDLSRLRTDFFTTLDLVEDAFGDHAFRRWLPDKQTWRKQVLAALFDAEIFAISGYPGNSFEGKNHMIVEGIKELFVDEDFIKSIQAGTNTPSFLRYRIQLVQDVLERFAG